MTLWMKEDITSTKKNVFSHVLADIIVRLLVWLQSLRFSLSTEHQLFMDFHNSLAHLGLGKVCTLPGNCTQCAESHLTPESLFVAVLLFVSSVAQKLWDKDSSVQKGLPFLDIYTHGFQSGC